MIQPTLSTGEPEEEAWQDPVDFSSFDAADAAPTEATSASHLAEEPLFSALLRRAVAAVWGDDPVMHDFVTCVAPPLSALLGHVTAKGGDFSEAMRAAGKDTIHYAHDQSMRAHLINGLFPALHTAEALRRWGAPQFAWYDDSVRRLAIAGYILHDWLKLPAVDAELTAHGLRHDQVNAAQHRLIVAQLFRTWGAALGLESFLESLGGLEGCLHDLIFIACNTQLKWGTLRALAALPELRLPGRQLALAESLSRLADYLAYLGRDPREVVAHTSLQRELTLLSDGRAILVYHHLSELRGVLTNLIHNAALEAARSEARIPLLYAPNGVVYLARRDAVAFFPPVTQIADAVVADIGVHARQRLKLNLTGFQRDGKGMKYADYYTLFFSPLELLAVGLNATLRQIYPGKKPVAGKRFAKLAGWLDPDVDLDLPDDIRVDQLAEWCFLVEHILADYPVGKQVPRFLLHCLAMDDLVEDFLAVPRDARSGGVGYHWYFAAGHYLKRNPGLDPEGWTDRMRMVLAELQTQFAPELPSTPAPPPVFDDLRAYIAHLLSFGPAPAGAAPATDLFAGELARYTQAKRRGSGFMCSLCSSPYTVNEQREAAILFAPQVYSNKLALHGAKAIRDICSICGLEMMLRQLLMQQGGTSGKNFEALNLRYLYLYPTYFFTPETLTVVNLVYQQLKTVSFTELRSQLVSNGTGAPELRFDPATWQRLEPLLLSDPAHPPARDRFLRLRFAENTPVTFFMLGVPPGRDAKDAEAWVHPAFLALLLPLCLDVKIVASEASLPLLHEAGDLPQTVYLDAPHAAIRHLVHAERINLDHVLPALTRLMVAYLIHVDNNSRMGAGGYDYRWQEIPALARRLDESSLYVFWYLKKGQRSTGRDSVAPAKAALYLAYQALLSQGGDKDMSHARTLTELYRRFYRGPRWNANPNSILRPLNVASKALLTAGDWLRQDPTALEEAVRGELYSFVNRVNTHRADGFIPRIERDGHKQIDFEAIDAFAAYFVQSLFFDAFKGNLSVLRGRQLNLLKNACEVIYRDLDRLDHTTNAEATESANDDLVTGMTSN
jgi:CRISPR-associated protein Csc3